MRHWILAVFIFAHCAANAASMWKERVHDGITVYEYALEKPRTMKVFVARIDLTTPGDIGKGEEGGEQFGNTLGMNENH